MRAGPGQHRRHTVIISLELSSDDYWQHGGVNWLTLSPLNRKVSGLNGASG